MLKHAQWFVAIALMGLVVTSASAQAPPGGGDRGRDRGRFGGGGFGGPGGFDFGGGGGMGLLLQDDVRKELEIVDEQVTKLKDIGDKTRDEVRALFSGLRDLPENEREAKMQENREKITKITEEAQKKVDEVLLPHQRERLKQIQVQTQLRFRGTADALSSKELTDALGLTEDQKKALADKAKEVQKDVDAKVEKVRQEGREQILSVLTTEQQEKFKKLMGEPFKFEPRQFNRGPGGDRGNQPGGDRGTQPGGGSTNRPAT